MNTRPKFFWWLLLTIALVALTLFAGCRAFQPEAVIVNRPPETFLIGAPLEGGGGYYHYHMFWYGSDEDGIVEKFAWALTDTSVQNDETSDDEEDARFNPALDITHLEIAHWTTKNDSIFDFQINQGTNPSADMTFHMVAVDDFGDFDRTPARLHFFSNTLGSPFINFFRINGTDTIPMASGEPDTVGFGKRYHLYWSGSTPNVLGYDLDALAQVDTVPPRDDGLFGYKWSLMGDLGGNCVPTFEDCWHPRSFNESTGDSFSTFAPINSLVFRNDNSSTDPFGLELQSGAVNVRVNSLDVAGVEVSDFLRNFQFVVNHDPETIILNGETDWDHPEDPEVYPYYVLLNNPGEHHPFVAGDRIPDRSYAVFKSLAKDHPDDNILDPDFGIGFTGIVNGNRLNYTGGFFSFSSGAGAINYEPTWGPGLTGWYADTLGFLVGPSTEFTFQMRSVDEHLRRDGTPAEITFDVGFPPCVQCVELLPDRDSNSNVSPDQPCYVPGDVGHECFGDLTEFYIPQVTANTPVPDKTELTFQGLGWMNVNKITHALRLSDEEGDASNFYTFRSRIYSMTILLHGMDDMREAWLDPLNRARAWRYQVDYDCDPGNGILDGGGIDDINSVTWGLVSGDTGLFINPADGLWSIEVDFYIPESLWALGKDNFAFALNSLEGLNDIELAREIVDITMRQMSSGSVKVVALDQSACGFEPMRPSLYHLFDDIRPPGTLASGETWRDCAPSYQTVSSWNIKLGAMDSAHYDDQGFLDPVTKDFKLFFQDAALGLIQCSDSQ